jgi:hypothetical protein
MRFHWHRVPGRPWSAQVYDERGQLRASVSLDSTAEADTWYFDWTTPDGVVHGGDPLYAHGIGEAKRACAQEVEFALKSQNPGL